MTTPDHHASEFLTLAEAAKYLRVCTRTVSRLIANGQLHALRVGNKYRLLPEDLRAYLETTRI